MRGKLFISLLLLLMNSALWVPAQSLSAPTQRLVDSLKQELNFAKSDTAKIRLRFLIGFRSLIPRISYWDSIISDARLHHSRRYEGKALNFKGYFLRVHNNEDEAFKCINASLRIAREVGNKSDMFSALQMLIISYMNKSDGRSALDYCYEGLKIAEELKEKRKIADMYSLIAGTYFALGEIKKALTMHLNCLKMYKEIKDNQRIGVALIAIGADYQAIMDDKRAIMYYLESKKYAGTLSENMEAFSVSKSVGAAYVMLKQFDSAVKYMDIAYRMSLQLGNKISMASTMAGLANVKFEMGDYKSAKKIISEAMKLAKEMNFRLEMHGLGMLLKKIYVIEGNYKEAYDAYEMALNAKEISSLDDNKKRAFEKEFNYNIEKKESENKLLAQQNQIQALKLGQNRYLMLGFGALALLILIIAWLLARQNKLKAAQQNMLLEQKLISSQMNPHFVFNSLNSIQQLIMSKENEKAELYLSKFAKLIRELLESNIRESITVNEEVGILKGYMEMEARRFGKAFSFSVHVGEKIDGEKINIPHMMIQPFVENSIWHGLLTKEGERNLTVNFEYDTNKTIKCFVEDNGIGREASKKKNSTFKKRSLALSFVKQRLELMKETLKINCDVNIIDKKNTSGESCGTKVELVLPILVS